MKIIETHIVIHESSGRPIRSYKLEDGSYFMDEIIFDYQINWWLCTGLEKISEEYFLLLTLTPHSK